MGPRASVCRQRRGSALPVCPVFSIAWLGSFVHSECLAVCSGGTVGCGFWADHLACGLLGESEGLP